MKLRSTLFATALGGTLGILAVPAYAQDTAATDTGVSSEEIVVTGLKREERLIEVPVSVQVFNAQALEQAGISRPSDFLQLTPNVNFYQSINRSDFHVNIRGQASVRNAEPSVRIIIDGVPVVNPAEFVAELVDVEQIEILRGPQGAFYGRNASAGAIVVTTKAPTNDWGGQFNIGYGNWQTYKANASIGGAIVPDKLLVRGTFAVSGSDGPFTNINTGEKSQRYNEYLGRARAEWFVTDDLKLDARVNVQKATGGNYPYLPQIGVHPLSPSGTVVGGVPITGVDTNFVDIPLVSDVPGRFDQDIFNTALKGDWETGIGTLTSITSYSNVTQLAGGKNLPYGNVADTSTSFAGWARIYGDQIQHNFDEYWQFNQELRLTSNSSGPLQWQVGVEYLWTKWRRHRNVTLNGAIPAGQTLLGYNGYTGNVRTLLGGGTTVPDPRILYDVTSPYASRTYTVNDKSGKNIAPFANVQYDVTDNFEIGIAGRYDIEKRNTASIGPNEINPFTNASYNQCIRVLGWSLAQCEDGRDRTFKQFQPKVNAIYKIPEFGSVFASWGKGFKTGGFNEIGTRELLILARIPIYQAVPGTTAEQARAQAEAAVFSQDYFDKEVATNYEVGFKAQLFDRKLNVNGAVFWTDLNNSQQYRFDPQAAIASIDSIDKSRVKGFEIDMNAQVSSWLTLFGGYGLIDSKIRKFEANPLLEGNRMPYTAKYSLSAGAQVFYPISDDTDFSARAELNRTGSTWFDIQNTANTRRDPYTLVNGRLGVVNDKWEVALWGRNLFNKKYATEAVVVFPYLQALSAAYTRSFGLEAKYKF